MSEGNEHAGDLLSALLDGELDDGTADSVREHVGVCAVCAAELANVRSIRRSLRLLPSTPMPQESVGLAAHAIRRAGARRRRVLLVSQAAAVALVGSISLAAVGTNPSAAVTPELDAAVERHSTAASALSIGLGAASVGGTPSTATTAPHRPVDGVGDRYVMPTRLGEYELLGSFEADGGLQLLYGQGVDGRGPYSLSLFEQPGALDVDHLPRPGRWIDVDHGRAWLWEGQHAGGRVLLVERGGLVLTLVGDDPNAVLDAANTLPAAPKAPKASAFDRLRDACAEALDGLSPVP
jgi:hypothetical protein